MNCQACAIETPEDAQFCGECGTSLGAPTGIGVVAVQDNSIRYHGLDALRGLAMLLGIVLHAALPYMPNIEVLWPADERSSFGILAVFEFIHMWRMPVFFMLAGFFANLIISRRTWKSWWGNRLLRIGLPMIVFWPIMSLTLPWIFQYGRTGEFTLFYSNEGQPFHLWFLWQLMIFGICTVIFRPLYLLGIGVLNGLSGIGLGFMGIVFCKSKAALSCILFRSRVPIVFVILCCVINLPTGGELIANPIGSGLYFAIGYSLYGNASLFIFLKTHWRYYFLAGIVGFSLYMTLSVIESKNLATDIYSQVMTSAVEQDKDSEILWLFTTPLNLWLLKYLLKITCAVLFSYAFIGLAESRFGSYNDKVRFVSDGAYWMYLVHLPIVSLITFSMFNLHIPIEIKFLIAIAATSIICLATYKYCVRSTPIGILLNGRRYS
jgi:glucan biosynthesis protein C